MTAIGAKRALLLREKGWIAAVLPLSFTLRKYETILEIRGGNA
jgi:hypothetical protein